MNIMNADNLPHQSECTVFCCKASYYDSSKRKWIPGRLFLRSTYITFVEETQNESRNPNEAFHLYISLTDITSMQRKQSTFVFAAIIIMVGSTVHWFSSFPNRDSVFNLLELFWRELLLLGSRANLNSRRKVCVGEDSFAETGHTKLGTELLSIVHESERTLTAAASMLESQGRQLEESEGIVEDINNDLSVVESLINTMSFWHGNSKSKPKTPKNVVDKQSRERKLHQIVFSSTGKAPEYNIWLQGKMEIKDNEVCLLDIKDQLKYSFHRNELSKIQVLSPWKMNLHKKCGLKNNTYEIMCPALSRALNVMLSVYKDKIVFEEEKGENSTSEFSLTQAALTRASDQACADNQLQEIGSISVDEIRELTTVLTNLQSLAVDVGREQEAQLERIDSLVTSVDKTDTRMKADIINIKEIS